MSKAELHRLSGTAISKRPDGSLEVPEPDDFWDQRMDPGLRAAFESLEVRKRRVIESRYLLGQTYEEAAAHLEIPLGTYKFLLRQGLAELRERLPPEVEVH